MLWCGSFRVWSFDGKRFVGIVRGYGRAGFAVDGCWIGGLGLGGRRITGFPGTCRSDQRRVEGFNIPELRACGFYVLGVRRSGLPKVGCGNRAGGEVGFY